MEQTCTMWRPRVSRAHGYLPGICGTMLMRLDNIESNITSVAQNTSSAAEELTTAHEYQRKAGRRMVCLLLILIVVILVILLAVRTISKYSRASASCKRYASSALETIADPADPVIKMIARTLDLLPQSRPLLLFCTRCLDAHLILRDLPLPTLTV